MLSENAVSLLHTTTLTASTTHQAYSIEVAPTDAYLAVCGLFAGGDGTTRVTFIVETSVDGTNWFSVLDVAVSSAGTRGISNAAAHLAKYVRARTLVTGTAPSSVTADVVLLLRDPFTATAL
jgi:hypothetical protein